MSLLTDLLDGHLESGVHHWHSELGHIELARLATEAGWRLVVLDTRNITDKTGFLDACREVFDFPDWTGHNYDALVDALRDVRGDAGVLVLWEGWDNLARTNRSVFDTAYGILERRNEFVPGGPFSVLLRNTNANPEH
ncbi:MAG: hypothetical protein GEU79_03995 [Acidimicrobiia bacterium]|nr:hypothetical protein [Acidimicrobiia bacterium]